MSDSPAHCTEEDQPEVYIEPLVHLKKLAPTDDQEQDEQETFKMRAKLYRYAQDIEGDTMMWKERGVGDLRILRNKSNDTHRVIMRRDKLFKLCANHQLCAGMSLERLQSNEKAFVYNVASECADEPDGQPETLCVRFRNVEEAGEFEKAFNKACGNHDDDKEEETEESEKLANELNSMTVKESEAAEKSAETASVEDSASSEPSKGKEVEIPPGDADAEDK